MGRVSSLQMFCFTFETVADMTKFYIVHPSTTLWTYDPTFATYHTTPSATSSSGRLQYTDVYMGGSISFIQGDPTQQHRIFELVLQAIKETYPSIPGEIEDSVSLKNLWEGMETGIQKILGWVVNTKEGTLCLTSTHITNVLVLLTFIPTQRHLLKKHLEHLIDKL